MYYFQFAEEYILCRIGLLGQWVNLLTILLGTAEILPFCVQMCVHTLLPYDCQSVLSVALLFLPT